MAALIRTLIPSLPVTGRNNLFDDPCNPVGGMGVTDYIVCHSGTLDMTTSESQVHAIDGGLLDAYAALEAAYSASLASRVINPPAGSQPATFGDINLDGSVDGFDIDLMYDVAFYFEANPGSETSWNLQQFDMDDDNIISHDVTYIDTDGDGDPDEATVDGDVAQLIWNVMYIKFGDSNMDGTFNSSDFVFVYVDSEYDDNDTVSGALDLFEGNSGWAEGDWNGDGDFDSDDITFVGLIGDYSP